MAKEIDREKLDKMVDVVLEYNRTPRRFLFEYPYRADESRQIIQNAEYVVKRIAAMLEQE